MTNTDRELGERIERLVQEHIAASRKAAQEAIERAFGSAAASPLVRTAEAKAPRGSRHKRRSADIAALGDRLYRAVCAKPGETMSMLARMAGASVRDLHLPMTLLRRAGRVRAIGTRRATRYFPMATTGA